MKLIPVLIAASLLLAAPFALAGHEPVEGTEDHPRCEDEQTTYIHPHGNHGEPYEEYPRVCEGEHWDGQDPTDSPQSANHATANGNGVFVALNGGPEPETPDVEQNSATDAFHTRLSVMTAGNGEVYFYGGLYGAGEMALYAAPDDNRAAWWGKDGTNQGAGGEYTRIVVTTLENREGSGDADGNLIAWLVGYAGLLPNGFKTGEGDCKQKEYQERDCERDNTAITAEW